MIGVIDVGGGARGVYGAGVFDWCLENELNFDYGIGVSAGSANIASYKSKQVGRCHKFYTEYFMRWQYMSMRNLLKTGDYIGLDYIYSTLSDENGEYPIDWNTFASNPMEMITVATDATTGRPVYFDNSSYGKNSFDPLKASSCVPVVNKPYKINGQPLFDGGLSDPIPLDKCFDAGCDKVVLVLTRPRAYRRVADRDVKLAKFLKRKYPKVAIDLELRYDTYNRALDRAEALAAQGKVIIVAPDSIGKMKTLNKDRAAMEKLYQMGYHDAALALTELL